MCCIQLLKLHSYQLQTFYSLLCMIFAYCKLLVIDGSVKWLSQSLIHSTNCPSGRYQFYHLIALCGHCRSTVEPLNFLLVTLPNPTASPVVLPRPNDSPPTCTHLLYSSILVSSSYLRQVTDASLLQALGQ